MIVDDEPHVVTYLEALLSDHGYETVTAVDGKDGLAAKIRQARRPAPGMTVPDRSGPATIVTTSATPRA